MVNKFNQNPGLFKTSTAVKSYEILWTHIKYPINIPKTYPKNISYQNISYQNISQQISNHKKNIPSGKLT